jgi:hypothetical protein
MIFTDVFTEIAVLLLISAAAGAIGLWLKQPLIVSFIAAGIVMGPSVLGVVTANDQVSLLAGLGISLLLFVVGLKLDLHIIRAFGPVALATGLGQVGFTSVVGFFLVLALGVAVVPAIYVAVALTFSSTIIIVKLLSDKKETDSLNGRITIGILIVQDILQVLGVDSDPDLLHGHSREGMETVYGDVEDPGFLASLPLDEARWVVNSIRDNHVNQIMLHGLEDCGYQGRIAVTANSEHEAASLREKGAHFALTPFADAAADAVRQLIDNSPRASENQSAS